MGIFHYLMYIYCLCFLVLAPIIFHVPNNITYHQYVGSNVTLQCSAINYDILQWQYHNGEAITELEGKYHFEVFAYKNVILFIMFPVGD